MSSVSVIIPTHNRAHTLTRALDSVLTQSHSAMEIIVIDDGSIDETKQLIEDLYPSVQYYFQNNRGVSAARNRGIRLAQGEWIALLDSDDEWLPHKLELQLTLAEQDTDIPLVHGDEIWIRNGTRVNQMNKHEKAGGWIFQRCLPLCAISPSAVMIKRSLFDEVGLFDEELPACEDYDLWLRICSRYPVHYCDEALIIKYGGHDDQLSRKHWGMDRFRIRALNNVLEHNHLQNEDRDAALETLSQKLEILMKGAHKHGNQALIDECEQLLNRWQA